MFRRRFSVKETGYSTHGIYRYPGKFIPQIPGFYIKDYSKQGEVVLDPFCGSGTTLVESMLSGRNSYGVDVHPIARLVTKVKTTKIYLDFNEVRNFFSGLPCDETLINGYIEKFEFRNFFNTEVLKKIFILRERILEVQDENAKNLFFVTLLSLVKSAANIDERRIHLVRKKKPEVDVFKIFEDKLKENIFEVRKLRSDVFAEVIGKNAKKIPLNDESVDLIVTSPPYINALNYRDIHKIEMNLAFMKEDFSEYIGVDAEAEDLVSGSKKLSAVEKYFRDMEDVLYELGRVLKPKKHLCLIIGKDNTIREIKFRTADMLKDAAKNFEVEEKTYRYASKEEKNKGDKILLFRKK